MRWVVIVMLVAGCAAPGGADGGTDTSDGTTDRTRSTTTSPPGEPTWAPGNWITGACDAAPTPDATAWVLDEANITQWTFTSSGGHIANQAALQASWLGRHGDLYAASGDAVIRLGEDLDVRDAVAVANITAFWASAEGIVLASDWDLIRLDARLDELWRTDLTDALPGSSSSFKSLDHMLIREGRVFVVDDVVFPFYGFIVDLASGDVGASVEWNGNGHSSFHAVSGGVWHVDAGFAGMGGASKRLERFTVAGEALESVATYSYSSDFIDPLADRRTTGHQILAMDTAGQALVHNGTLAWVTLGDAITTHCSTPPPLGGPVAIDAGPVAVAATGNEVVALWKGGHMVRETGAGSPVQAVLVAP